MATNKVDDDCSSLPTVTDITTTVCVHRPTAVMLGGSERLSTNLTNFKMLRIEIKIKNTYMPNVPPPTHPVLN